jgi:hypothetical protein
MAPANAIVTHTILNTLLHFLVQPSLKAKLASHPQGGAIWFIMAGQICILLALLALGKTHLLSERFLGHG